MKISLEGHLEFVTKSWFIKITRQHWWWEISLLSSLETRKSYWTSYWWERFSCSMERWESVQTTHQRIIGDPSLKTSTESNNTLSTYDCVFGWSNNWLGTWPRWLKMSLSLSLSVSHTLTTFVLSHSITSILCVSIQCLAVHSKRIFFLTMTT
jgi:hypothetical protein